MLGGGGGEKDMRKRCRNGVMEDRLGGGIEIWI